MPTNHPQPDQAVSHNVFIPLALCAFVFGTAVLVLDARSGATTNRGLFMVAGALGLAVAVGLAVAAVLKHRRATPGR